MDKNKSRTDLLAAGRKKLQQFRQKKDKGSGSHGKSTKKSGKSEQHEAEADADADADVVLTTTKPTALSQVREGETESPEGSNSEIVNTSVSNSAESDTCVAVVSPSAVPITHEKNVVELELEKNTESPSEEVGVSKPDGFKSLTTSRMVPRFTRPVTDMVDDLWVSCDRTLMRKPILRLGIIFYWAFLHALLATLAI